MLAPKKTLKTNLSSKKITRQPFLPRVARHRDDTEGVAELSPGLPDFERATLGIQPLSTHHSRAKRGEQSEHIGLYEHRLHTFEFKISAPFASSRPCVQLFLLKK